MCDTNHAQKESLNKALRVTLDNIRLILSIYKRGSLALTHNAVCKSTFEINYH